MAQPLVLLFAAACGLSVANVYYAQPLLDTLAAEFGFGAAAAGLVITATQAGCALALLLLVPLGDMLERRRLTLAQLLLLCAALLAVGLAGSAAALLAGMLAVGLLGTAMTQGLIGYAASAAAPAERGRVVGAAQSGVVVGLLLARALAGAVADAAGWRAVYFASAALALLMLAVLWRVLPAQAPPPSRLGYARLLASMAALLARERTLQIRGVLALLLFAAFSIFWSALVFPLSAPPYAYSHTAIGAFGLVGALGALGAARAGRLADRGRGQWTSGAALLLMLAAWLPLGFARQSLWALLAGIVALDLAGQAIHVTNQSMILRAHGDAHSRLVGCYMLFYALGSGAGALAATAVHAAAGWTGVCLLGAAVNLAALLFWRLTLRHMPAA
ncbi:MFS transporter [Janthinobacterium sp. hw3]|uniref:MFS transporter n=2 Tax=Janthinobacterium fluminis TaxID=2987524 RepID=A0ABT5JZH7_9BURK|nr:MFS transporter [Janthinobacterium fluminis]MDC8757466.1 MFS transporter [Janthinobacterium fluminis]